MGRARVELEPLKNQRLRKWFPLSADSEGKKGSSNVRVRRHCCFFDLRGGARRWRREIVRTATPAAPRRRIDPAPG